MLMEEDRERGGRDRDQRYYKRDYDRDHRRDYRDRRGGGYEDRGKREHEGGHGEYRDRNRERGGDRDFDRRDRGGDRYDRNERTDSSRGGGRDYRDRGDRDDFRRDRGGERDFRRRRSQSRGRRGESPKRFRADPREEEFHGPPPDVLPISQWPRKLKVWDVPPEGYESWSAKKAKESGLFAMASQAIKSGVDGTAGLLPTGMGGYAGLAQNNPAAQSAFAVKQAKRLFVGDLPPNIEDADVAEFFNKLLEEKNGLSGLGRPVVNAQIQSDQTYAFVEFRTPEEASQSIQFDGAEFFGANIKIRRPKEYVPPSGLDILPAFGLDSNSKMFIGQLPTYLTEEQVKELLQAFGELKAFHLGRDDNGVSKGYAFCEYLNTEATETAIKGLDGMELGEQKLAVERASSLRAKKTLIAEAGIATSLMMLLAIRPEDIEMHPVVLLANTVEGNELKRDGDYEDTCADLEQECSKYGQVVCLHVPRPIKGRKIRGIGKVFVEYENVDDAQKAAESLHGRRFNDRIVVTGYFPRDKFYKEFYDPNMASGQPEAQFALPPPPPPPEQ